MTDRNVIDTCGWLEVATSGVLEQTFLPFLARLDQVVVPTVVIFECFRWGCRERSEDWAMELAGLLEQAKVVPLSAALALQAATLAAIHGLAMADAIIYATAQSVQADLITCDAHFSGLPGVMYLPKLPAG
ncbi:MAG: type II toxin-antitoxin system VapC family toxin [Candidatus Sericytochromatia bacterium]|nr:type II toxin-antitoxin system VapC family toxin [Candidatus Sericytochromatia bacterium]